MTSMTQFDYDQMRRQECAELTRQFCVHLPVKRFVCDDIKIGPNAYAMLFESGNDLYALLVDEDHKQTLADVKRIAQRIGLRADRYFPPGADPRYFIKEGVKLLEKAYPAKKQWAKEDVLFYGSQTVYSPALIRVTTVSDGLNRYSVMGHNWQHALDFSFRKVQVL